MPVQKEASHLWLFESHNNSKRSQWLQSTLSELEEKTKGMLKLIEGDADTFAQRAEMYYKKRPELVNMIEDFYRSYRSLAERYELLKLESGNSFSNRGYLNKDWSFLAKSSASSSVTCDSESEVDDPSEEEQVESKLREVPRNKNGNDLVNMKHVGGGEISQVGIKRERSDLSTYSIDSELSEVSYQGPEETKVETKSEEFLQKKSYICVVKQMIEKVESTEDKARTAADNKCFEHSDFHGKPKEEGQDENNLAEFPEKADSSLSNSHILTEEAGRIQSMIKKMAERSGGGSSFEDLRVLHPEREETQGEPPEKKRDDPETKLMSVVERLRGENMTFKNGNDLVNGKLREVPRNKNGDDLVNMKHIGGGEISQVGIKREISDLSTYSIDSELSEVSYLGPEETKVETKLEEFLQKKSCICVVKQMIGKVESTEDKARTAADNKCFEHSDFHGKPKEGQDENNSAEFPEKADSSLSNSNILTEEAGRIQSMIKKMAERSGGGSSFEDLRILHPEREETQGEYELKEAPEKKRDNPETKLMSVVERLRGENMTFKAELELKDEEKREVIRQLSLSIDLLKGENDSMKKFIRDSKNRTSPFEFRKLKGVFSRKLLASQSKFPTTLVAL